jgi:uncharacterized membrane protein
MQFNRVRQHMTQFDYMITALMVVWVLAMISLPIQKWVLGENALATGISIGVLLQLMAVWSILVWAWGVRRTALVTGGIILFAWLVEYIGHTTGFPFGAYAYTDRLQPQIGGVPLLIPLAWLMMLPSGWVIARRITRHTLGFILVSALAFTAWDLFLDPQMVGWNLWLWNQPSGYFGIPWTNFAGWLAAAAIITALVNRFAPLGDLPTRPLMAIYAISWALETIGLLCFWGLTGPALVGGVAMGAMLVWALKGADPTSATKSRSLPLPDFKEGKEKRT